jgi:L-lactate dehydrogenase complex protein LldG
MNGESLIEKVRRALGRSKPLEAPPVPPVIEDMVARLVYSEVGLPELFAKQARAAAMTVDLLHVEDLFDRLEAFLRENNCQKIALPVSKLFEKIGLAAQLQARGFDVKRWDELTPDECFGYDCGVTDAYAAVAETGSIVVKANEAHGRCISLVPPIHVAVLEPKVFVPDLVDLFEKLQREGAGSGTVLITGPSKTSDIEGQLVTGVHGPGKVQVYVLQ